MGIIKWDYKKEMCCFTYLKLKRLFPNNNTDIHSAVWQDLQSKLDATGIHISGNLLDARNMTMADTPEPLFVCCCFSSSRCIWGSVRKFCLWFVVRVVWSTGIRFMIFVCLFLSWNAKLLKIYLLSAPSQVLSVSCGSLKASMASWESVLSLTLCNCIPSK